MQATVSDEVVAALTERFGQLERAGAGAWSVAYRLRREREDLIVRVGPHVGDFQIDAEMAEFSSDTLPIPRVVELDRLDPPNGHLHVCVSTFAAGTPLELVDPDEWVALVPAVADALDAMRATTSTASPPRSWPDVLLAPSTEDGDARHDGWREQLVELPEQLAAHGAVMDRLVALCRLPHVAEVPLTLLHCDLVNRNVHVDRERITGIFDWGCRRWGDHLYDLAWFRFWEPWLPNLDIDLLEQEVATRLGVDPDPDRMAACLLHIGADHLVYNAAVKDPETGAEVLDRLLVFDML